MVFHLDQPSSCYDSCTKTTTRIKSSLRDHHHHKHLGGHNTMKGSGLKLLSIQQTKEEEESPAGVVLCVLLLYNAALFNRSPKGDLTLFFFPPQLFCLSLIVVNKKKYFIPGCH